MTLDYNVVLYLLEYLRQTVTRNYYFPYIKGFTDCSLLRAKKNLFCPVSLIFPMVEPYFCLLRNVL